MQFMGKDNVPFHTVIFPASLLGTGQSLRAVPVPSTHMPAAANLKALCRACMCTAPAHHPPCKPARNEPVLQPVISYMQRRPLLFVPLCVVHLCLRVAGDVSPLSLPAPLQCGWSGHHRASMP